MRLYGYITNSGTLGKTVGSWESSDLNGNMPFQWLDSVIGGYEDIHTIELINTYGFHRGYDYKFVRDAIKSIVIAAGSGDEEQGFSALLDEQKEICSRLKVGTFSQRLAVLGINDLVEVMTEYRNETQAVRETRSIRAEVELRNRLHEDTAEVLSEAGSAFGLYKMYGIDGTTYGDTVPGIGDYVNSSGAYTGAGLRDKDFTPEGMNLNDFCDLLIDILIHGKY